MKDIRVVYIAGQRPFGIDINSIMDYFYCPFRHADYADSENKIKICEIQSHYMFSGLGCGVWTCSPDRCPLPTEEEFKSINLSKRIRKLK